MHIHKYIHLQYTYFICAYVSMSSHLSFIGMMYILFIINEFLTSVVYLGNYQLMMHLASLSLC